MKYTFLRMGLGFGLALAAGLSALGQTAHSGPPSAGGASAAVAVSGPVSILTVGLRLNSMEPSSLTVPAGRYLVHIINGIVPGADFTYQVKKAPAAAAGNTGRPDDLSGYSLVNSQVGHKRTGHTRMLVSLTPGQYVLTVQERTEWQCAITVTAPKEN